MTEPKSTYQTAIAPLVDDQVTALADVIGNRHIELVLGALGDGISIQDGDLRIIYQNKPHQEMLGEHLGEYCYQAYERKEKPCSHCPVLKALHSGKVQKIEKTYHTACGTLHVAITASPLKDEHGRIIAAIEVVKDVTDKVRYAEDIHEARNLESIGYLAGGIAHDYNNMLTAILGNIELAQMAYTNDRSPESMLRNAKAAALQARDLTRQLLTFAEGGVPGVKSSVSIRNVLTDSLQFSLRGSSVSYQADIPPDLLPVEADLEQISQVVHNLAMNAREAMAGSGEVRMTAENVVLTGDENIPLPPGKYVRISLRDNGIGIPGKFLRKIFDPYFTAKKMGASKGVGLGLSICYSIITKHGGYIGAESIEGQGATFYFYLPAVDDSEIQAPSADVEVPPVAAVKQRILVMDDEDMIILVFRDMLTHLGYDVDSAGHGDEALQMYQGAMAGGRPYDAVILDLTIRGGMGGLEVIEKMSAMNPRIKAIVSSGYADNPVIKNYRQYGFCDAIPKPFNIQDVQDVMNRVLTAD